MSVIYGQPITFGGGNTKAPAIFGDGSDGVAIISADTQWLAETEDTGMIVKNFESLTIAEGVTVSAGNRNCGMIIRVTGDCTIAGSIVNKLSPKTILDSDGVDFSVYPPSMLAGTAGDGGDGGNGMTSVRAGATPNSLVKGDPGIGGTGMKGRFYGGGWSAGGGGGGCRTEYNMGGDGGDGGSVADITTAVNSDLFVGGGPPNFNSDGPDGSNGGGGSGANGNGNGTGTNKGGNGPGGDAPYATVGGGLELYPTGGGAGNYGGGVIILLVGGKLTITGTIDCSGGDGGDGGGNGSSSPQLSAGGGSGGGGGGGRIFICHKGAITNTGVLNVNGGSPGAITAPWAAYVKVANTPGVAGTIGTVAVKTYKQYMEEDAA